MNSRAAVLIFPALLGQILGPLAFGQSSTRMGTPSGGAMALQKHWVVGGMVRTEPGDPVQGARVQINPLGIPAGFRILTTDRQGEFKTDYLVNSREPAPFRVSLIVSKKGFPKAYILADSGGPGLASTFLITLRSGVEDPALLPQSDLIASVSTRLKALGPNDGLSTKGEKEYQRGAEQFLNSDRPERALPSLINVVNQDPDCFSCRTMLALAELAAGDWDSCNDNAGLAAKATLADPAKGRLEPWLVLGVLESWKHDPEKASGYFAEALKFAPSDPLALQEYGRAQLLLGNPEDAQAYLSKAMAAGAGDDARLLLIKAWVRGGHFSEASQEMKGFLNGRNPKKMPLKVRTVWAELQDREKVEASYAKSSPEIEESLESLKRADPELQGLVPTEDQKPLDGILKEVGKNVEEFFHNLPNTSSLEEIQQEKLNQKVKAGRAAEASYEYVCAIQVEATGPNFNEYRLETAKSEGFREGLKEGFMLTSGFASAQIIFHPLYQSQSTFRYLGKQRLDGRETDVVAFAQRPATSQIHGAFKMS